MSAIARHSTKRLARGAACGLILATALTACEQKATTPPPQPAQEKAAAAAPIRVQIAGPSRKVAQLEGDQLAAYVTDIAHLKSGGKIYSTAGGDPAVNGLYTYIASPREPAEGIRVFQIGDFNSWKLTEDRGNDVVLEVSRSWFGDKGDVQTAEELLIVSVPTNQTTEITITPARR